MAPDQIDSLMRAWEARDPAAWENEPARYLEFGKQAIRHGRPGFAYDILSEGRAAFPRHRELRYGAALALAKSGSLGQAAQLVRDLLAEPDLDARLRSDSLSLAGRIAKDRWARLPLGQARTAAGAEARSRYREAFELTRDPFPGINAATMSALTDREADGRGLAAEVLRLCDGPGDPAAEDYWLAATRAEACIILEDKAAAREWYAKAAAGAAPRFGEVASMRRQLKLLAGRYAWANEMLDVLKMPRVAVFAGHMIDRPGRVRPRFPPHVEARVAAALARTLRERDVGIAYCSAACGGDIVFAEQMLARDAELNVVLPFAREDFLRTSVSFAGRDWVERFDRVLARATSVSYCVEESHLGDDVLFAHAATLIHGMALLRARELETDALMIVVAEPEADFRTGGTADSLGAWRAGGREAVIVDLRALREREEPVAEPGARPRADPVGAEQPEAAAGVPHGRRQVKTLLFADVVGYSRLREHQTPAFFVQFLQAVEKQISASRVAPAFGNTWGDGLYLVFDEAEAGADFALRLRDSMAGIDWSGAGLPPEMSIRIGMHTGPVFRVLDPIIQRESYFGSHVTRAARIEPVATPGSVYITEQMAAALAATAVSAFACDYLGSVNLAKHYGATKLYRLRRSSEAE
jgi:class 3 adenylate cyclase